MYMVYVLILYELYINKSWFFGVILLKFIGIVYKCSVVLGNVVLLIKDMRNVINYIDNVGCFDIFFLI